MSPKWNMTPYLRVRIWSAILLTSLVGGCAYSEKVEATYCVSIDVHAKEDVQAVSSQFFDFGKRMGLEADIRDKVVQRYMSEDGLFEIGLSHGMGDFGTIVTFYPTVPGAGQSVMEHLERMVDSDIAPKFDVTKCSDIKGFKNPFLLKPI